MKIGDLYGLVLMLVLVGLITGIGVLILDQFGVAAGIGATASGAINDTRDALTPIAETWMAIIVIIAVTAIILGLVINSFRGR
jgi:MFS superfamily sulfate permease-like transporter